MEKQIGFYRSIRVVALVTVLILLVPLVAMQFTNEVAWSVGDFLLMGLLLFTMGVLYVLITRNEFSIAYKVASGLAIGATFLMIWANLAVGLIGAGPNAGNLMYIGVLSIGILFTFLSQFKPIGMARAMYVTALALVLLAVIALLTNMHEYPGSSVNEIVGVNGFFAALFLLSGFLFYYSAKYQHKSVAK